MTRHRTKAEQAPADGGEHDSDAAATNGHESNGAHAGNGRPADVSADERMRRAEEVVDRVAQRVGDLTGQLGRGLLWLAARAREEAEDIWAEARPISRGKQP